METVKAYINHGRWLVDCPKHGKNGAVEVAPDTAEYIAPCCYPGVIAQFTGVVKGQIKNVVDTSARATARRMAHEKGEVYQIVFPKNADKILAIIQKRPIQNQNWIPGETLKFLQAENDLHEVT